MKKKKTVIVTKRCRDCGDSWKYAPNARRCHLCGGNLEKEGSR